MKLGIEILRFFLELLIHPKTVTRLVIGIQLNIHHFMRKQLQVVGGHFITQYSPVLKRY